MSKIQFNELSNSEFNALNQEETAAVVGGYWGDYISIYTYSDDDIAALTQTNLNGTQQTGLGGKYGDVVNINGTGQGNSATIYQ